MALIARIHAAGQSTRIVRLRKGRNRLELKPGEQVEIVDEKTGQAPDAAHADRVGDDLVVTASSSTVVIDGFYAASAGAEPMVSLPGTGYAEVTPTTSLAACAAQGGGEAAAGAAAGGGMSTTALAVLGALAIGGSAAAVASGGKANGGGQTGNQLPPAAPTDLDLAAADDSGASNSDNLTSQTGALTITGRADAGSMVQILSGTTVLGSGTATAAGTFSIDITLPSGATTITARASNSGGASAASAGLIITVDAAAPAAPGAVDLAAADDSGASSSDNITSQTGSLTISGTAEAGSRVELFAGATSLGTTTATAAGTFSLDVALPAGTAAITARATDVAGNVSSVSSTLSVTVDTTAPAAPTAVDLAAADDAGASNSDNLTSQTNALTLTGTAEAGARVTLFDGTTALGTVTAGADGSYSLDVTLAAGTHTITASATDAAGNAGAASSATVVTVETVAPTIVISSSGTTIEGAAGSTTLTFTFSEAPAGFTAADVSVQGGAISNFAATANPLVYTATLSPALAASGTIAVSIGGGSYTDAAGNAGGAGAPVNVAFDAGTTGSAVDGYIANALVFRDVNNNGTWDRESFTDTNNNGFRDGTEAFVDGNGDGLWTAERFTITDANGDFSSLFGTGRIVLTPLIRGDGTSPTIDISTGAAFTKQFSAPAGSSVVTPLTTLVEAVAGAGATAAQIAAAEQQVKTVLGISGDVDLKTFDPIGAATATGASAADQQAAVEVQKAAVQVANIINVVSTAAASSGSYTTAADAAQVAAMALASQIMTAAATGDTVNLSNSSVVASVIGDVAAQGSVAGSAALTAQAESVSSALATVNEAVSQVDATADVNAALAQVVATQIVAQVDLSSAVSTAIDQGGVVIAENYSGTSLANKVDSASAMVEVIVPVAPSTTPQALGAPGRPTIDDGARVDGNEIADGVQVSVSYDATAGVSIGDRLRLMLGGVEVGSATLGAGDVPSGSETRTLTIAVPQSAIGGDGSKVLTASFVAADASAGPESLPVLLTVDTVALAPTVPTISGGFVNAAETAAGTSFTLGRLEIGATIEVTLTGPNALPNQPAVTVTVPRVDNEFRLTSGLLGQFADGQITISARQTDGVGNVSAVGTGTFVLDRTAPDAITIAEISNRFISGAEATAGVPLTIGSIDDGATVLVTVTGPGAAGGTTTQTIAAAGGTYSLSPTLLAQFADGALTVNAVQTDAAGNSSGIGSQTVQLSRGARLLPPSIGDVSGGVIDAADKTAGVTFTLTGVEANATATVQLSGAGLTSTQTLARNPDGSYTLTPQLLAQLVDGTLTITARQTDLADNASGSDLRNILIDATAPSAPGAFALRSADDTGASSTDRITNKAVFTVTGTGEAGAKVDILDGMGAVIKSGVVASNGTFAVELTRPTGSNSLSARLTDAAGNVGVAGSGIVVVVDTTPPAAPGFGAVAGDNRISIAEKAAGVVIPLTGVESGATTSLTISGNDAAAPLNVLTLVVPVVGGMPTLDTTLLSKFANGTLTVRATQTDVAGNKSVVAAATLMLDVTAPGAPMSLALAAADDTGVSNSDRITRNTSGLTITGTAEAGSSVELFAGSTSLGTTTAGTNGAFTLDVSLPEGTTAITARATDAAGNASGTSAPIPITVDTAAPTNAPTVNFTTPQAGTLVVSGATDAGATVTVSADGAPLGTTTADANGAYSFTTAATAGVRSITVQASDAAGNPGPASVAVTVGSNARDVIQGTAGTDRVDGAAGNDDIFGNAGADILLGGDGDDALIGGSNNGGAPQAGDGADMLFGGAGADVLRGGDGDDVLMGEAGDDNLRGDAGDDMLDGGEGRDFASYRFDHLTQGQTIDFAQFGATASFSFADGLGGTDQVNSIEHLGISGSQGDDTITGSLFAASAIVANGALSGANQISGGGGNDTIFGGNDADSLHGDNLNGVEGNDVLHGGGGADLLFGEGGTDQLLGEAGDDMMQGGAGNDAVDGGDGIDTAYFAGTRGDYDVVQLQNGSLQVTDRRAGGTDGTDTLVNVERLAFDGDAATIDLATLSPRFGTAANDVITGTAGAEVIWGNDGADTLRGGDGTDILIGGEGNDMLYGGSVSASIDQPGDGADLLFGGAGADLIRGGNGNDQLFGGAGDDNLRGDRGNDILDGGDGVDFVSYFAQDLTAAVNLDARNAGATATFTFTDAFGGVDTLTGIEGIGLYSSSANDTIRGSDFITSQIGGGDGDDTLFGGATNSILMGDAGNDTLSGEAGDDTLIGGTGNDTLDGGTGADTAVFAGNLIDFRIERLGDGSVRVTDLRPSVPADGFVNGGVDLLTGVEKLAFDDTTIDVPAVATTVGTDGNDVLTGGAGNDFISGGAGNDSITGAAGADTLVGDDGDDTLIGGLNDGGVAQPGDGADGLFGGAGNDTLRGGDGNDQLSGGIGNDTMRGDAGDDVLDGGDGTDAATYRFDDAAFDGGVTFDARQFAATTSFSFADGRGGTDQVSNVEGLGVVGGAGNDVIRGSLFTQGAANIFFANGLVGNGGDDTLEGGGFGDYLQGDDGNDTLSGFDGSDQLIGGAGNDSIDGGAGGDVAVWTIPAGSTGTLRAVQGTGADSASVFVERVDGATIEALFKVTPIDNGASYTVTGLGSAASLGTDTVTNVEQLRFLFNNAPFDLFTTVGVAVINNITNVLGTIVNDTLDVAVQVPAADATTPVNLSGGFGDDSITGHAGANTLSGGTGNDSLVALGGNDFLEGGAGNDSLNGGTGFDVGRFFLLPPLPGTLRLVDGTGADTGQLFIERVDGATVEKLFRIAPSSIGQATVTGLGSAAFLGTDTVVSVEDLRFQILNNIPNVPNPFVSVLLDVLVPALANNTFVNGSIYADNIDLAALYPTATAAQTIGADAGRGDDTLSGNAFNNNLNGGAGNDTLNGAGGDDFVQGADGNDMVDGGAGTDTIGFNLPASTAGSFRVVDGVGADLGKLLVQRVDGQTVETIFRVTVTGTGAATVEGLGSAAFLGTDTVTNAENLDFGVAPFDAGKFARIDLTVRANPIDGNGNAFVSGSAGADSIDLTTLYPTNLNGNFGINAGAGADTLVGNAGSNYLEGGAGNDSIDGGAGVDNGAFVLPVGLTGTLRAVEGTGGDAGRVIVERVDGATVEQVARISRLMEGSIRVEGLNSAAALGTDNFTHTEFVNFGFANNVGTIGVQIAATAGPVNQFGGFVSGSALADTIDVAQFYPGPGTPDNIGANGGLGDDTLIGHAGTNHLEGGFGNDSLDGGAGFDNANFAIAGLVGQLQIVDGTGADAGRYIVQRVDGATTEPLFRIELTGSGSATVTGLNSAAAFGTDMVTNIEFLNFFAQGSGNGGVGLQIGVNVGMIDGVDFAFGSVQDDTIDIALLYPNAGAGTAINANGNRGNDSFIGHAGANRFFGDDGDDIMTGAGGNDELFGGNGNDVAVFGGNRSDYTITRTLDGFITVVDNRMGSADGTDRVDGNNLETLRFADQDLATNTIGVTIKGTEGAEQLSGTNGPDTIFGFGGNDGLNGQDGDDTLNGGAGDDYLNGGGGDDLAVFSGNSTDYTITPQAGGQVRVTGPDGDDTVANTTDRLLFLGDNVMIDLAGDPGVHLQAQNQNGETLTGGAGDDTVNGAFGNDTLSGGAGDDSLFGSDGNDILNGNAGDDDLNGWVGNDQLFGGAGNDLLIGETGDDLIVGDEGNDTIIGGDGADVVRGEEGADFIDGGVGNDILLGGYFGDHVAQPGDGGDTIRGFDGNDVLRGGDGDDILEGGDGDDNLRGDLGNDTLDGGAGTDFVSIRFDFLGEFGRTYDHGSGITFDASMVGSAGPVVLNDQRGGTDTLISIEAIGITGTDYNDTLIGGTTAAFSQLTGYGGNDTLVGGNSFDDIATYTGNFTDYTFVRQGDGTILVIDQRGGFNDGTDTLSSIETLAFNNGGQTYRVGFIGDDASNFVGGADDNDILIGNGGDDYLNGEGANDLVNGGAGRDTVGFRLAPGTTGTLRLVDGTGSDAGKLIVERLVDGQPPEAVFRVTLGVAGSATVEGLGIAASLGTDQVANVEQLDFFVDSGVMNQGPAPGQYVGIRFDIQANPINNGFAFVNGSEIADSINIPLLYPAADATVRIDISAGRGNDSIVGHAGDNYIRGERGSDTIDGAGGRDTVAFALPLGTPGTLHLVDGTGADAGKLIIERRVDGQPVETVFRVTVGATGSATVEAIGSAAGFGTDSVTNVEQLDFFIENNPFDPAATVVVPLGLSIGTIVDNFAFVGGGVANDAIDLLTIYPGATAATTLNSNGNRGDDNITGHEGMNGLSGEAGNDTLSGLAGNDSLSGGDGTDMLLGGADDDYMQGEGGNDSIDGGTGANDIAAFTLASGTVGMLRTVEGTGADAGKLIVQRVDGAVVEDLFRVTLGSEGQATVEGLGARASFGTDTVVNVDELHFAVANAVFDPNQFTPIRLTPRVNAVANGSAFVEGAAGDDNIDLAALYPAADATIQLNSNGNRGNDSIVGHAGNNNLQGAAGDDTLSGVGGNDTFEGGAGNDSIDGGADTDFVRFLLPAGTTGTLSVRDGMTAGSFVVQRTPQGGGTVEDLFLVTMTGPTSATVQGLNAAAFLGTDTVSNVERLEFFVPSTPIFTAINFAPTAFPANGANPAFIAGSVNADSYSVADFFPGADANTTVNGNGDRGDDTITGHAGTNNLNGAAGNDQIFGLGGDDTLTGNAGGDTLEGGDGDDVLIGGNNTGASAQPGDLADILRGGAGDDLLRGGDGDDTLEGGDGGDNLRGDGGNDTLDGGADRDFVSYRFDDLSNGVNFDATQFAATTSFSFDDGRGGTDQVSNVEQIGVSGSQGDDVILGSLFTTGADGIGYANQLSGFDGNDTLTGGDSFDRLDGGNGNDTLNGGGGDDDLIGGAGDDMLNGGDGIDRASFNFFGAASGITLDASTFAAGTVMVADGEGGTDTLVSIESVGVTGSEFDDTLTGSANDDEFEGGGGSDVIAGGAGVDEVFFEGSFDDYELVRLADGSIRVTDLSDEGNGADILTGVERVTFYDDDDPEDVTTLDLTGPNAIIGTLGSDTLTGTAARDGIYASDGNDTLRGGDGDDYLSGGAGDDRFDEEQPNGVAGGLGDDLIDGGAGNDFILDFFGANEIRGGEGNDTLGGTGDLFGDGGNDIFLYVSSGPSSDRLFGGAGNDIYLPYPAIEPNWVADHVLGFEIGNPMELIGLTALVDQLTGYAAGSNLFGGGFVRYQQQGANAALQVDFDGAANGAMFQDLLILDNITLTTPTLNALMGRTNLLAGITGNRDDNSLGGTANNDFIRAFGGNDFVQGNDGNDNIDGGTGNDELRGGNGDDTLIGEAAFELTAGNDFLLGGAGNDTLIGGGGDDNLRGDDGNDTLIGGDGTELMRGGAGTDSFDGGASDPLSQTFGSLTGLYGDRISFFEVAATAGVIADLRTGIISNDGFGNVETMVGIESLGGDTAFADQFFGNDERNLLLGSRGDTLMGFAGDDSIQISGGPALADGGTGIDELNLTTLGYLLPDADANGVAETRADATAGWSLDLAAETAVDGFGDTGTVRNFETVHGTGFADTLLGGAVAETLNGNGGDDTLDGRGGDDVLAGGSGFDTLTGGAGADRFVLENSAGSTLSLADLITDFEVGTDHLELGEGLTFAQLTITDDGNNGSVVRITDGAFLATVQNVAPGALTSESFLLAAGG